MREKSVIKSENMSDQKLGEELQEQIIRKFEKHEICSSFKDNI